MAVPRDLAVVEKAWRTHRVARDAWLRDRGDAELRARLREATTALVLAVRTVAAGNSGSLRWVARHLGTSAENLRQMGEAYDRRQRGESPWPRPESKMRKAKEPA